MSFIDPTVGVRLVFLLGITNIISLLLVLFSCRCLVGIKIIEKALKQEWYRKFYSLHCYYWWLFIISVALHTIIAFLTFGVPSF